VSAETSSGTRGQAHPPVAQGTTALVVLVPEAQTLVGPFRSRYDPVAPLGMPPHVTILFPFLMERDLSPEVLRRLTEHFAGFAPFDYEFRETGVFSAVLYLKPEPEGRFSTIIAATSALFPALEPYGEAGLEPSPHLTVAHAEAPQELEEIRASFEGALARHGPVRGAATEATLMLHSGTAWLRLDAFGFSARSISPAGVRP
jgi:2'-5' RNA ligase